MSLEKLIANPTACRFWYNLTRSPNYLNCLIEHNLDNEKLNEAYRLITEEFIPKTLEKSVDQTQFACTYFLYGEYLLRCGQLTMAKVQMKRGFDLALSSRGMETPRMLRRIFDHGIYKKLEDDEEFLKMKEQLKAQTMNNFYKKASLLNYFTRGDKTRENEIAKEMGWGI